MKCSPRKESTSTGWKPNPCSRFPRERRCTSVIQACWAFHTIGGTVQMANRASNEYRFGRANSRLSRGAKASTSTIETISSAFVYLERNPSPTSNPVNGQYQEKCGLLSMASQNVHIAASQKKTDNASMVMRNAPTLKIGVTFSAITAHNAAVALNKRRAK